MVTDALMMKMLRDKIFGKGGGCGCCGTQIVGSRQIDVSGTKAGIVGHDQTIQEYLKRGKKPEDLTGDELLKDLKKLNFIAEGAEEAYKKAFLREYERFFEARKR